MLTEKRRIIFIVIHLFLILIPITYANPIDILLTLYNRWYFLFDFLIYFTLFSISIVPHSSKIFGNEQQMSKIIGFILATIFSISITSFEMKYNFRLIDLWYIGVLLLVASGIGLINKYFPNKKENSFLTPIFAVIAGLSLAILIFPDLTYFFPFYYFKNNEWIAGLTLGISLLGIVLSNGSIKEMFTNSLDSASSGRFTGLKGISGDPNTRRMKRVIILTPTGKNDLTQGKEIKLQAIVENFDPSDKNLEYIWTSDFPINNFKNQSIIIKWEDVSPTKKTLGKKINVTIKHNRTQEQKSASTYINFIKGITNPEQSAKVIIRDPSSRGDIFIEVGKNVNFNCALIALDHYLYNQKDIYFEWYIIINHTNVTLENVASIGGTKFGKRSKSFSEKIPTSTEGKYTIFVTAVHNGNILAVDSKYIILKKREIKYTIRWYKGRQFKKELTGDSKIDKAQKASLFRTPNSALDTIIAANPHEKEFII